MQFNYHHNYRIKRSHSKAGKYHVGISLSQLQGKCILCSEMNNQNFLGVDRSCDADMNISVERQEPGKKLSLSIFLLLSLRICCSE